MVNFRDEIIDPGRENRVAGAWQDPDEVILRRSEVWAVRCLGITMVQLIVSCWAERTLWKNWKIASVS